MKLSPEDKRNIQSGNLHTLKKILSSELESIKNELLVYKKDNREYDLVLQGKGNVLKELLELIG